MKLFKIPEGSLPAKHSLDGALYMTAAGIDVDVVPVGGVVVDEAVLARVDKEMARKQRNATATFRAWQRAAVVRCYVYLDRLDFVMPAARALA